MALLSFLDGIQESQMEMALHMEWLGDVTWFQHAKSYCLLPKLG